MKIKELLIGLLIIIIPLSLLYICNKRMIKEQCDYNLTCIKNELENNIKNFNKSYETNESFRNKLKNKLIKKKYNQNQLTEEEVEEEEEEIIEPFFDGIKGWFSGSSPSSTNVSPPPMLLPPPANVHQNINESLDSLNKKKTPLVSTKFPPDDNEDIPNLLQTNGINVTEGNDKNKMPSGMIDNKIINVDFVKGKNVKDISTNNEDIKLDNDIKLIKKDKDNKTQPKIVKKDISNEDAPSKKLPPKLDSSSNNMSNLFGKCQFFNTKCPDGYNSFGNFSIEGVGSNLSLSCGNIRDTKPAKAVAEIKNNAIYEIHILEQGHGYIPSQPPRITIEGGKGNGASAEAVVDDNGYLKLIKVVNPGYNYSETPNIVIEAHSNDSNCHFCCKE
jgi:hypothetical protein